MTKEEQIEARKIKPFEVGDRIRIIVPYQKKMTEYVKQGRKKVAVEKLVDCEFNNDGTIEKIVDGKLHVYLPSVSIPLEIDKELPSYYKTNTSKFAIVDPKYASPTFFDCGANPFGKEKRRINFYNQTLDSIINKCGYKRFKNEGYRFASEEEDRDNRINFDPFVIDANGEKKHYQRGLVWTLEQKQNLIESIYQDIEIGKFLFRYNSWERLSEIEKETGKRYSWDCVDGKQRLDAILGFIQNEFADSHGNYWKDLCGNAHRRFLSYGNLSYGELPETASDEDVIDNFLTLNFTGVPMSKDHIEYVKSFNMK